MLIHLAHQTASYLLIDFISKHYNLELAKYFCTDKILLLLFHIYVEVLCKIIWGKKRVSLVTPSETTIDPNLEIY